MNAYSNTRTIRQCASLVQASEYNLFVLTNAEQRNSDIEGRAAIGGNALFSSFSVGSKICNAQTPCPLYGTDPTLVVGGNLIWANGSNFAGNTVMTPSGNYKVTGVTYHNADSTRQPVRRPNLAEDFQSAFEYFRCAARQWNNFTSLPNTTTVINCNGNVFLIGLNQDINVFHIDALRVAPTANVIGSCSNTFDTLSSLTIIAPDSSTILINVNGAYIDFGNYPISRSTMFPAVLPTPCDNICSQIGQGIVPSEAQKRLIFWNFYNATSIVTSNASFQGTVFAPFSIIYTTGGNIEGSVIAEGFLPNGNSANHTELHNYLFNGCLPVVDCSALPCPTSSSTTSSCTTSSSSTSSSTTSSCTTSSSSTSSCTTSSSTTSSCTTWSCTTWSCTTSSCTTSSSSTSSCTTSSSSTSSCTTSSSTTSSCTTSSSSTSSCTTSSSTTSSCTTSSYTTSSCTTSSCTTSSCTTWSHTTSTFTTPCTSSTTTLCPPRCIHRCPRCGRKTSTWRFNGRFHHYCFYCGYHYAD
ncbi:MAG TPA: choice-of-anchor A family protein [Clostridiales bacterium]|nr:choice-of-anchor A family protein [Clostridiales bacterium]